MAKESGLGDALYLDEYDLTGDTGAVSSISAPFAPLILTGIDKYAPERKAGHADGKITWQAWHNPANAHVKLSALPRTDVIGSYFHGGAVGNVAASMTALQVAYSPSRGADGSLTFEVDLTADGFGLEWGLQGTAGKRSDTIATNGASINNGAATAFGLNAYLHVFSFTGTSVTITIQDSADNASFAALTGGAFSTVTAAGKERIATTATQAVRQYLRVITAGTFSQCTFAVNLVRNKAALAA